MIGEYVQDDDYFITQQLNPWLCHSHLASSPTNPETHSPEHQPGVTVGINGDCDMQSSEAGVNGQHFLRAQTISGLDALSLSEASQGFSEPQYAPPKERPSRAST